MPPPTIVSLQEHESNRGVLGLADRHDLAVVVRGLELGHHGLGPARGLALLDDGAKAHPGIEALDVEYADGAALVLLELERAHALHAHTR